MPSRGTSNIVLTVLLFFYCSYEQSGTHKFEVVRMLINEPDELLEYTVRSQDK